MKHLTEFVEPTDALAFVPTMGALHDGHLALIRKAHAYGKKVLVSVYINPTQFESADDLAKYPKTLAHDLELAKAPAQIISGRHQFKKSIQKVWQV